MGQKLFALFVYLLVNTVTCAGERSCIICDTGTRCNDWLDANPAAASVGERIGRLSNEAQPLPAFDSIAPPVLIGPSPAARSLKPETDFDDDSEPDCRRGVTFRQPATFPVPEYYSWGTIAPANAAVIYEGMTVVADNDGRYEVQFAVEAPATDVEMRLQLCLWKKSDGPSATTGVQFTRIGTVTLAPIHFKPTPEQIAAGQNLQWQVKRSGNSPLMACLHSATDGCNFYIERVGTAQFGSIPKP